MRILPTWQPFIDATTRIAPAWPLDRLIAVNPLWQWRDTPFAEVTARMAALGDHRCLMAAEDYLALHPTQISDTQLQQARDWHNSPLSLLALKQPPANATNHWRNISDLVDAQRTPRQMAWHEEIVHQISQFCGDWASRHEETAGSAQQLYQAWLDAARTDRGLAILMAEPGLSDALATLPNRADELIDSALGELAISGSALTDYGLALLLDIHGWASHFAWRAWQAGLNGQSHDGLRGLLAIRLAWDWLLWQLYHERDASLAPQWQQQWQQWPHWLANHRQQQEWLMVWQSARELACQQQLMAQLDRPAPTPQVPANGEPDGHTAPVLQAVFCIDVRSEVIRRALEAQHPGIETLGYAGFFGLPLAWQPTPGHCAQAQLPGLLAPAMTAHGALQAADGALSRLWSSVMGGAPTAFSAVESAGISGLLKLWRRSFQPGAPQHPLTPGAGPLCLQVDGQPLDAAAQAELAAGILRDLGLTERLAPRVLLVGHASSSSNNPHAAGLDCGACGGQSGELNARVLAQILNDDAVREQLARRGLTLPTSSRFVAALHDTTTDEIHCFAERSDDVDDTLRHWLDAAGAGARAERAARLGLPDNRLSRFLRRAADWSEVRPEWGLAGNHSMVVAPRARTRHLHLDGRSFLHDYQWQQDEGFARLTGIMTAPMLVAHWINMQYHLSVTDPLHFGSGSKLLHNVVGGGIGVFEGNGGDLRIGLPWQSVHDGEQWQHDALRLNVFIAAPPQAIAEIVAAQPLLTQLVDNQWLALFALDAPGTPLRRLYRQHWHPQATTASSARGAA